MAATQSTMLALGTPDLRAACDALLSGAAVPARQTPSLGCNIKWKS